MLRPLVRVAALAAAAAGAFFFPKRPMMASGFVVLDLALFLC